MYVNDDGGSEDPFVARQLTGDVQGIRDFAHVVQDELDQNFLPTKDRITAEHRRGVGFGLKSGSLDMRSAVMRYFNCLSAATDNLDAYVKQAEILVAAANMVAEAFHSANELSTARLDDIDVALSTAVSHAKAAEQAAARDRSGQVHEQRMARLEREGLL